MEAIIIKHITVARTFFRRIKDGMILHIFVGALDSFGLGFASYYFHTQGVPFYKIMIIWAISPLVSLPIVWLHKTWNTRRHMLFGLLGKLLMGLSLLFFSSYSFVLFGIGYGLALGYFWVSFNYVFFVQSDKSKHAKDSSIYFILGPLIGIVLPTVGAVVIDSFSFKVLFLLTCLLTVVPIWYSQKKVFNYTATISFREANKAFSGLRLYLALDAALHFFQGHFLAIYALLYLKSEYEVGGLLSYLAILSLVVSFIFAHISDRSAKRAEMLYPLHLLMATVMLVMPHLHALQFFIFAVGIYAILDNLSLPIRFAVPMDVVTPDIGFWRVNEFWGNLGRTVVFAISAVLLYLGSSYLSFILFAIITLVLPFFIRRKLGQLSLRARRTQSATASTG